MKKFAYAAFTSAAAMALAACGSADDASEDAMADTVEMPADEAMAPVEEEPAADAADAADAATEDAEDAVDAAKAAGDAAAKAAADAAAAAGAE